MGPLGRAALKETFLLRDFLFLTLAVLFFVVWLVSWLAFHVAGGIIHVLLVIALILLIVHFVRRPRAM